MIGRDTRRSGRIIENVITSILNYRGIDTSVTGVIPTPGLSSILEANKFSMGIMITASHNPASDNGIKLYNSTGFKLDRKNEQKIEKNIISDLENPVFIIAGQLGSYNRLDNAREKYVSKLKSNSPHRRINGKILVDCSNGALSGVAKLALQDYGEISFINDKPNGDNVNFKCGALEPKNLLNLVRKNKYDYGVAFDGDGDRSIFVSSEYGIIETEKLIVLFSKLLRTNAGNKIAVSTEICNKGLESNFEDLGFQLIQTKVGDRYVVNSTRKNEAILGAEPSGHYFFPKKSKSMDGLLAFFHFLELLQVYGDAFNSELKKLKHYNRIKKDILIEHKTTINIDLFNEEINSIIDDEEEKFVIRKSMWDPVIRIYYDYKNKNNFRKIEFLIRGNLKSKKCLDL